MLQHKIGETVFNYQTNEKGVHIVSTENDNELGLAHLVLDEINGAKVTTIGDCFLGYNKTLTSIELPNVTSIGDVFFYYNEALTSVDIPNATSIGDYFLRLNETPIINKGKIVNRDGVPVFVKSRKTRGEFTIIKGNVCEKDGEETYLAIRGKYSAHGKSIEKAIQDCNFKFLQATVNVEDYAKEVKEKGFMTIQDYRILTGACEQGCKMFLSRNGFEGVIELPLDKALPLVNSAYGFDRVRKFFFVSNKLDKTKKMDTHEVDGFYFKGLEKAPEKKKINNLTHYYEKVDGGVKIILTAYFQDSDLNGLVLDEIDGEKIIEIGEGYLFWDQKLKSLSMPNVVKVGDDFLYSNEDLETLHAPNLIEKGKNFLLNNNRFQNKED